MVLQRFIFFFSFYTKARFWIVNVVRLPRMRFGFGREIYIFIEIVFYLGHFCISQSFSFTNRETTI